MKQNKQNLNPAGTRRKFAQKKSAQNKQVWTRLFARLGSDNGSQLIEFSLTVPIFLVLVAGTIDFGRAYFVAIEVSAAAEAGATYGLKNPTDTTGMQSAASLDAPDLAGLTSTASYGSECSDGTSAVAGSGSTPSCTADVVQYVEVDTSAIYKPVMNYPGLPSKFTVECSGIAISPQ